MAAITLDIAGNTRQLDRDIQKTVNQVYSINLKTKGDQPLGRITGQVNEFTKSLDASNARVIAFGASAGIIFGIERAFTALVASTIEVQKSLQDINVILNTSQANLQKFGAELFNIAKNTGQSFQEVSKAATEFSRQGLGVEETLKRTNEALILSRLSGLDAAKSVETLTAAVNSFASQAVTATEVVNKFATVDAAFAVSSADLAEAISRVGSSAAQSGVSLNELIAIVTSAQQTTARGGAVIGNSFKTIFTRLERGKVQDILGSLGIGTTDSSGQVKSTIQLLQDLGKVYDALGSQQKAYVAEQVGGVFQINILKAALGDLGKEYSIYNSALNVASGATDQAIRRNEELNKTYAAQINVLTENARQLAAAGGERLLGPSIDRLVGGTNTLLEGFSESDGQGVGEVLGKGILDGLGQFISGPGLALIGGVLLKLFRDLAKFATGSVQQLLGLNTAATQQRDLQQSINQILAKNPQLLELALKGEQGLNTAANSLLASLQQQTVELQKQATVAQQISKAFVAQAGVRVSGGVPVVPTGRAGKASGYIPNFAQDDFAREELLASALGARNPTAQLSKGTIDGRKFIKNNREVEITGFGSNGDSAVIPTYARGFVPNFAKPKQGKQPNKKEIQKRITNEVGSDQYKYLVPSITEGGGRGVDGIIPEGSRQGFQFPAQKAYAPKLKKSGLSTKSFEERIYNQAILNASNYTNQLNPPGLKASKEKIEKNFEVLAGAKGALQAAIGSTFEVAIVSALDYEAAQRSEGGDFDVRGGVGLKNIQSLFNTGPFKAADFKSSTTKGNVVSFRDKIIKELSTGAGSDFSEEERRTNAKEEAARKLKDRYPLLFSTRGKARTGLKSQEVKDAEKKYNQDLEIETEKIFQRKYQNFASGYIPNFAAIQDAVSRERAAGIPSSQIYLAQEQALKNANSMGLGVFNKKDEPTKGSRKDAMRRKGFASGFIPNFAIEDPDIQGASPETATAAIISALSGVAFAFAFTGNQFKDSLKELTSANQQAGRVQREISAKQKREFFDEEKRLRGRSGAETRANERAQQAQFAPGGAAKTGAFFRSNALGLSIAAPILGETIKNAVGQETAGARQFGAVASGAGQIGSFAATGALIAKGGGPIGLAIGALLTIPGIVNEFTTEMPELAAAAKKASQDLTKFSDVSQRLLAASSSLSEFTDKGASPEKLKKVQDDFAKALAELTPAERARIESSIKVGNLEEELARITQERIDQERLKTQAVAVRGIAEKKGFLGLPSAFDPNTAQGKLDEETIRGVFKGFFTGKTPEETLANFNKAAQSGVPQLQNLQQAVAQLERDINTGTAGRRNLYGTLEGPDYREEFTRILEGFIPQGKNADEQEARSRFIKDLVSIADNDIKNFQNILKIPIKSLTIDRQQLEEGIASAKKSAESTALFNKEKEKYTGIIDNSISSLNRAIATFNALADALDQFQVNEKSFEREQGVGGLGLRKSIAETVLGPEAELTRRAALFEKIAQNESVRLDAVDQSNLTFRQNFRENLKDVFTERANEIATKKGQTAITTPEQAALANEISRAVKLFESGAIDINKILESSFKDGVIDPDQLGASLGSAFQAAEFKTPATEKILDSILSVAEKQNTNLLDINQKASQDNQRAAQEFANEKILLDIRRSLQVFGGIEKFLAPPEEGIIKPLETLIKSATGQLKSQRGFEFGKRTGTGTSFGTESQVQNNIGLGQSALNFIKQLQDLSGGAFTPDPGSELYRRATAGLTQSFENNIKQLNDVLKNPKVDQAFKSQIQATLEGIRGLGSSREIAQLQVAQETGSAFQSTLEGTLSRLQDPAIQQLRDAGSPDLADAIARNAQYTSNPIVNVLNVQKTIVASIATQLEKIGALLNKPKQSGPPTISIPASGPAVQSNSKGLIPAFAKERMGISRGVGGAKAGDRPQFIPNLNGGPAFVNSGEKLVDNFMGSSQTAVLTRDMQNAMVAAKGFIPNFAPGQKIVTIDEIPKAEPSFKTTQGKVIQDLTDTGRNYIVIRSKTPLDDSFVGKKIPFGPGKQSGEIMSIDPNNRFDARVGKLIGLKGDLPPSKGNQFIFKNIEQKLKKEEALKKIEEYKSKFEQAILLRNGKTESDKLSSLVSLRKLNDQINLDKKTYTNLESYPGLKNTIKNIKDEYDRYYLEQNPWVEQLSGGRKNQPVIQAVVEDNIRKATAVNPQDLLTDATKRAAQITANIGKYTGLNFGTNDPRGLAGEELTTEIDPKITSAAVTRDNRVKYKSYPTDVGMLFNEATAINQNQPDTFLEGKYTKTKIKLKTDTENILDIIQKSGGIKSYAQKLKKFADFLENQNKTASEKFLTTTLPENLTGNYLPSSEYTDPRVFGDPKTGQFVASEFQYSEQPLEKSGEFWSAKYVQERASTLNDFLSRGIISGAITPEDMGQLGIPLKEAQNIVAETIAIDKQLKDKKPYQPSRPVTPPPAVPGIPTVPPPPVKPPPVKPPSRPVTPPPAVPGIPTVPPPPVKPPPVKPPSRPVTPPPAVPGVPTAIPKPGTDRRVASISENEARAIIRELDVNYDEAIRKQRNPEIAFAWAQTRQSYRLLYSRGEYTKLKKFYDSLTKNYQRPIDQGTGRPGESVQRFADGFIPNFAQDYISNLAGLESGLSGEKARLTNIPGIGLAMINEDQAPGKFPYKDHPEGKISAIKNSLKMQKNMGVMNKGFIPNFAVTDQSFAQQEAAFSNNTNALTTLAGGIEILNSTLSNFEANLTNIASQTPQKTTENNQTVNNTATPAANTNIGPFNTVVNATAGNDLDSKLNQAINNLRAEIYSKLNIKTPPQQRK